MNTFARQFSVSVIGILVFAVCFGWIDTPREAHAQSLLTNGNLNTPSPSNPSTPLGWMKGGYGTNNRTHTYPVPGPDGSNAAKVDITSYTNGDVKWFFQPVSVTPGMEYRFTDVYTSNATTELTARFTLTDGSFSYKYLTHVPASASWVSASATFTAPPNATHATILHILFSVGSLTIDDATFELVDPAPDNLITNPSLETVGSNGQPVGWKSSKWGNNTATFTYPIAGTHGAHAANVTMTSRVGGDAKWTFTSVAVQPGTLYAFSNAYRSNVETVLTAQFKRADGTFVYDDLLHVPPSAAWNTAETTILTPADVTEVTIFHLIKSVGTLDVDDFRLERVTGGDILFDEPMVSIAFDDGWYSQYKYALPILEETDISAGFYIITDRTEAAGGKNVIPNAALETPGLAGRPANWRSNIWGGSQASFTYPVAGIDGGDAARVDISSYAGGDAKWYADAANVSGGAYEYSVWYRTNASSSVTAEFTSSTGAKTYKWLGPLAPTTDWMPFTATVNIPAGTQSIVMLNTLASVGWLEIDNLHLHPAREYIDMDQVRDIASRGHEIGSHTQTHPNLATISEAQAITEINDSKSALESGGIDQVETLIYPFGAYNTNVQQLTENAGYTGARTVDEGYNVKTTNRYALKTKSVDETTTFAEFVSWVETAAANNTWLILTFHHIEPVETSSNSYYVTQGLFRQMAEYVRDSQISVVTIDEGLHQMNQ